MSALLCGHFRFFYHRRSEHLILYDDIFIKKDVGHIYTKKKIDQHKAKIVRASDICIAQFKITR
jgi:hypothetical protein